MTRVEPRRHAARKQGGYVLITVLASLVVLSLVALRIDSLVERWRDEGAAWTDWHTERQRLASTGQTVLACLLTRPLGPRGFGTEADLVRVDGRAYRLPDGERFSVQDMRGLISVAEPMPDLLRRFLTVQGLSLPEVNSLIDKLADYTDADDLRRLNGAEKSAYVQAGLPPPRNDWLVSPYELRTVLGWRDHPELWERAADWASAVRQGWVNPNTAPPTVLQALPGATPQGVAAVLQARDDRHIANAAELQALSGIMLADDPPQFHPGIVYRLRFWLEGGSRMLEYTVMLTLTAPSLPWALLETRVLPRTPTAVEAASSAASNTSAARSVRQLRLNSVTAKDHDPKPPLACAALAPG